MQHLHRTFLTGFLLGLTGQLPGLSELGPGYILLEVPTSAQYDSNIYANNSDTSDLLLMTSPRLSYTQDESVLKLELGLGARLTRFVDASEESSEDLFADFSLSGFHRDDSRLDFSLTGGWQELSAASPEVGARIQSRVTNIASSIDIKVSDKTSLRLSGGNGATRYRKADYGASDDRNVRLDGLYHYSEKLALKGGMRYRDLSYFSRYQSQRSNTVIVGSEGPLTAKINGTLEVGYADFKRIDQDFLFYSASLNWAYDQKRNYVITGLRDNSASPTGESVINTDLRVTLQQRISEKLSATAFFGAGQYEKGGSVPRKDDIVRAGFGLSNALDETSSLDFDITNESRSSALEQSDYNRLQASVRLSLMF